MLVAIVSDSHDRGEPLARAVAEARDAGAKAVVHCGDVIGAHTLKPLLALGLPVHVVHGNNLGDSQKMWKICAASGGLISYYGQDHRAYVEQVANVAGLAAPATWILADLAQWRFDIRALPGP